HHQKDCEHDDAGDERYPYISSTNAKYLSKENGVCFSCIPSSVEANEKHTKPQHKCEHRPDLNVAARGTTPQYRHEDRPAHGKCKKPQNRAKSQEDGTRSA